jgi:hypothetical protein
MAIATVGLPKMPWLRRHVVTVVFAVAYLLMSALIVEQGRVIDSQRTLIRQLFRDSVELTQVKVKAFQERHPSQP